MQTYDSSTYGDHIASEYDDFIQISPEQTHAAVETLAALTKDGPVLELGIGTGRIALPLRERGLAVHGIDASSRMVDELRKKPGGDAIPVTIGDFGDVAVTGRFSMIFIAFNTFFGLLTQEAQVRCFANVAGHLTPDGLFVIEAFVPDPSRFIRNQNLVTSKVSLDKVRLDASIHDPLSQRVDSQHIVITNGNTRLYPVQMRYAWPSELDLMAQLAGFKLKERWSNWQRSPFTSGSSMHISVYEFSAKP
ncbi:MAG TPA: class I SAM-dependent methyltransferase [Pseudacidobacterium sp.]|jgi:SAM-dependent methyltransferase|nr:class I SAM-dependent methyltransferase [Pseudacidobacterium sp.]